MQITQERASHPLIQAYTPGTLKIQDTCYCHNLVIAPNIIISDWSPPNLQELSLTDMQCILELKPEIIILGSGKQLVFPARDILQSIQQQKIGIEVMDSAAACRTYNLLLSEGRNVVVGLII